jgi:penicillin amidase
MLLLSWNPISTFRYNREYAYGLTMFENDDIDLYQEENNPTNSNQYKTPEGFDTYAVLRELLK